jgi:hypothetical protein
MRTLEASLPEDSMSKSRHLFTALTLSVCSAVAGACGGGSHDRTANTAGGDVATPGVTPSVAPSSATTSSGDSIAPAKHHSKLAGAAAGAVAGHMLGGHAVAGAAAGALLQHERNKHGH